MSPYPALSTVASFPPAALPAFFSTIRRSDSLHPVCLPPSFRLSGILSLRKASAGSPELPCRHNVMHAKVIDPGETSTSSSPSKVSILTSALHEGVVFPLFAISGLNPFTLSDSGLHARRPTHKVGSCLPSSKGLATWWLAKPSKTGIAPACLLDLARSHPFVSALVGVCRRYKTPMSYLPA